MTREEAIKIINCYDIGFYDLSGEKISADKLADAFDMAIEALQAKTDGDLISRADVLALAEKGYIISNSNYKKVCDLINELPSADRPTELLKDGTLKVNVKSGAEVSRVLVWGDDGCGGLYYADDRPNIAYFCDGAACDGECNECHHTTDIKHAKNFNIIGGKYNIKYIETDYRPSGEWICEDSADMSVYWFECSECGEKTPRDNFNHEYKSNYCPNCGAYMGGTNENPEQR